MYLPTTPMVTSCLGLRIRATISSQMFFFGGGLGMLWGATTFEECVATVHEAVAAGINLEGGSTGGQVFNNISVDNGVGSPRTKSDIRVDPTSTTGATVAASPDTILNMPIEMLFDYLAVRLNGPKAAGRKIVLNLDFRCTGKGEARVARITFDMPELLHFFRNGNPGLVK